MFDRVSPQINFAEEEQEVLKFWRERKTFQKSLEQRRGAPEFVFYDGPPFATGLPHYGHLLAGTIKDVVPRYQTMCGKYVDRVFGWDCHGLPVENEMEKTLGINSKHEIEDYGVGKFNEACRSIVLKYTSEWETVVERMGRWVDFEHGYRTMDRNYMESIWWVFRQLWDKGLVYEGNKIMWYCPRCSTPLSNFEVNQGYVEVEDPAITVRFKVDGTENTYFLAWTTTPWTLPANLALTVGLDIDYVEVEDKGDRYILAAALVSVYWRKEQPTIIRHCKGADLVGMTYEPLFDYFAELKGEGAYRVISGDFVSTEEGTGIVHTAPGFGEEDYEAGKANNLPSVCPIDDEGKYTPEVTDYVGRFVKDCDPDIMKRLKVEGKLFRKAICKHNYPHCWRCDAPLLNKAISTWFVSVEKIKESMLAANSQILWVPGHLRDGRFGKWLAGARDWAISRNRYWGCPLPIWRNEESGEVVCIGSIQELEELTGEKVDDIHKHFVDKIELPGGLKRVPEVLDCWFESGSMPYAQRHYPFENSQWLEEHFPADFIAEGLDQTRGWFYTLAVLGAALFDKPAFQNVIVNGMVLAEDGKKMSKRLKNYPDPMHIMDTYGADAMRLYMLSSPVVRGDDMRFSENRHMITLDNGKQVQTPDGVQETMRNVMIPMWNAYSFFVTYAKVDDWQPKTGSASTLPDVLDHPLDQWIVSRLEGLVRDVRASMDVYELQPATCRFVEFVDQLTNWYIRRSRRRFWKSQNDTDKDQAYATLYHVLVTFCRAAAPFIPFMTETIFQNLRHDGLPESVHLCDYPVAEERWLNEDLDRRMARAQTAVSLGRYLRSQASVRNRQPLHEVHLVSLDAQARDDLATMQDVIADELNVKAVRIEEDEQLLVHLQAKANFKKLGRQLGPKMKAAASVIAGLSGDEIDKLRHGNIVEVDIGDGEVLKLTAEDIEIRREEKPGLAVANEGDVTVALDLNVDGDLELEGIAREVVHTIQEQRKKLQLNVTDRISVRVEGAARLGLAVDAHREYIVSETLADNLVFAEVELDEGKPELSRAGDYPCLVNVSKV